MNIICAMDYKNGIGIDNSLPWNIKEDIQYFKKITQTVNDTSKINAVIMGRKTWETIPNKFRPLNNRLNIVLTRSNNLCIGPDLVTNKIEFAIEYIKQLNNIENIFIIGGSEVYNQFIGNTTKYKIDKLYITHIHKKFNCNKFFPEIGSSYILDKISELKRSNEIPYKFAVYSKTDIKHPEFQYIDMLRNIMENGNIRSDRTGTGTKSLFGCQMRYDISKHFPLLTTKRMYWKGIVEELIWFLSGDTDANILKKKNVHIWDGNSSRKYLDSVGLQKYREGECGPIYGFNFRHFGGEYKGCDYDYHSDRINNIKNGCDQVKNCINLIKNNPNSRRILINLWNPCDLDKVSLPACHVLYQFYVNDGKLSCSMYQRSGDMGLGIPFNIASASLMTYIFVFFCKLEPGEFIHTIGDAHIYLDHIDSLKEQLKRKPRPFPFVKIINKDYNTVEDFSFNDFIVEGYYPMESIKMKMAI